MAVGVLSSCIARAEIARAVYGKEKRQGSRGSNVIIAAALAVSRRFDLVEMRVSSLSSAGRPVTDLRPREIPP